MFDCPAHSHTSPTSTSPTVSRGCPPASTFSSRAVLLADCAGNSTSQRPFASATALAAAPLNVTVISCPAAAVPHTGSAISRCSTMLFEKIGSSATASPPLAGSSSAAPATAGVMMRKKRRAMFMGT